MMRLVIFTCDLWKSRASMDFKGVFTNKKQFLKAIRKLKKDGYIELSDDNTMKNLWMWSVSNFNDNFDYLFVEEIEFNQLQ